MTPADVINRRVSFDHQGKRLVGVVPAAKDNGKTARGAIPDLLVTVQGGSGSMLIVSFVETYMRITPREQGI